MKRRQDKVALLGDWESFQKETGDTVDTFEHGQSDEQLVEAARSGDAKAFERLVERNFGTVYAIALARVRHRETAEDIAQEVFLRAHLFLDKLQTNKRFAAWLAQIAHNLATDWHRHRQSKSRLLPMLPIEDIVEEVPDRKTKDAREMIYDEDRDKAVQDAIFELPLEQRKIILLHFMENMQQNEIADRLNVHPATVSRHLKKALAAMKESLAPVLRDSMSVLRPTRKATVRAVAVASASAALSSTARADVVEAAGGAAWLSTVSTSTASTGIVGLLKSITASIATGGSIMGIGKTIAITAVAAAVIGGGYYYAQEQNDEGGQEQTVNATMQAPMMMRMSVGSSSAVGKALGKVANYQIGPDKDIHETFEFFSHAFKNDPNPEEERIDLKFAVASDVTGVVNGRWDSTAFQTVLNDICEKHGLAWYPTDDSTITISKMPSAGAQGSSPMGMMMGEGQGTANGKAPAAFGARVRTRRRSE